MAPRGIAHNSRISRVATANVRRLKLPANLFSLAGDVRAPKTGRLVKRFEQIAGRLVEWGMSRRGCDRSFNREK